MVLGEKHGTNYLPYTSEMHPTQDTSRHLHFPTKKAPAISVTDAFTFLIINTHYAGVPTSIRFPSGS